MQCLPETQNEILDDIITRRCSIRTFTQDIPSRCQIEKIITAGMKGPYARAAVGETPDFRRFIVFSKGSAAMNVLISLLREKGKALLQSLDEKSSGQTSFMQRLQALANGKIPGPGTAPYLIVVAEQKGMPAVEQLSIAHCLENMWLKATALNLGFHLVSALSLLADDPRFWELSELPSDRYAVNGCAVGVPAAYSESKLPAVCNMESIIWV